MGGPAAKDGLPTLIALAVNSSRAYVRWLLAQGDDPVQQAIYWFGGT